MTDAESIIFSTIAAALRAEFPGIFVSGDATASPSSFPAATLVEMDNSFYLPSKTLAGDEKYSSLMYQADAYSTKASGKKSECKAVMTVIDAEMHKLGFTRVGKSPVDMPEATKYRITARYKAVISRTGTILRIV